LIWPLPKPGLHLRTQPGLLQLAHQPCRSPRFVFANTVDMRAGIAATSIWLNPPLSAPPKLSKIPIALSCELVILAVKPPQVFPPDLSCRVLFVLRGSDPLPSGVLLAHVGATFRIPVVLVAAKVVNFRIEIRPHHGIGGTVGLCSHFRRELVHSSRSLAAGAGLIAGGDPARSGARVGAATVGAAGLAAAGAVVGCTAAARHWSA